MQTLHYKDYEWQMHMFTDCFNGSRVFCIHINGKLHGGVFMYGLLHDFLRFK